MLSTVLAVKRMEIWPFLSPHWEPKTPFFPFSYSPNPEVCSRWRCPFPGASRALRSKPQTKKTHLVAEPRTLPATFSAQKPPRESWGPAEKLAENICLMKNAPTSALALKKLNKSPAVSPCRNLPSASFSSGLLIPLWPPDFWREKSTSSSLLSADEEKIFSIHSTQPCPLHSSFPLVEMWQRRISGHGRFSAVVGSADS